MKNKLQIILLLISFITISSIINAQESKATLANTTKDKNTKIYYRIDKPGSIADFEKEIKNNPNDAENYAQLGIRYSNMADQEKDRENKRLRLDKALEYYTKAITLQPENYVYYEYRAMCYKKDNYYILAADDYIKAIELNNDPKDINNIIDYYKLASDCYKENYEDLRAEDILLKGIDKYNNNILYIALGDLYYDRCFYEKALDTYQKSLNINPNDSYIIFQIAKIYTAQYDFTKAIEYCKKAIALNDKQSEHVYYQELGNIYILNEDYINSKKYFEIAIKTFDKNNKQYNLEFKYPKFKEECQYRLTQINEYMKKNQHK